MNNISSGPRKEHPDADWPPDCQHPEITQSNSRNRLPSDSEADSASTDTHNPVHQVAPHPTLNVSPLSENMIATAQPQFVSRLPDPIAPFVLPHASNATPFVPPPQFHLQQQQLNPTYSPQSQFDQIQGLLHLQHNSYVENIQRLRWQLDQQQWILSQTQAALEVSTKQSAQLLSFSSSEVAASEGDARSQKVLNEQQHESVLKLQNEALNNLYKYTQIQQQIQQQILQQLPLDHQKLPQTAPPPQPAPSAAPPAQIVTTPQQPVRQPPPPPPQQPPVHQPPSLQHPPSVQQSPFQQPATVQTVLPPPASQPLPDPSVVSHEHRPRSQSLPTKYPKRVRIDDSSRRASTLTDIQPIEESLADRQEQPGKIPILGQKVSRYQAMLRRRRSMAKSWRILKPGESPGEPSEKQTSGGYYPLNTAQLPANQSAVSLSPTDQHSDQPATSSSSTAGRSHASQPDASQPHNSRNRNAQKPDDKQVESRKREAKQWEAPQSDISHSDAKSKQLNADARKSQITDSTSNNDPSSTSSAQVSSGQNTESSVLSPLVAPLDKSKQQDISHKQKWMRLRASPLEPRVSKISDVYNLADSAHKPQLPFTPLTPPVRHPPGKGESKLDEKNSLSLLKNHTGSDSSESSSKHHESYDLGAITTTSDENDSSST